MAKLFKADATTDDAFIEIDLGSDQPTVWVTVDVRMTAGALAWWIAGNAGYLIDLRDNLDSAQLDAVYVSNDTVNGLWATNYADGGAPYVTADEWHTVELQHVNGGAAKLYVDGTLLVNETDTAGADTRWIRLGIQASPAHADNVAYFRSFKAGTTRGGSDVFSDSWVSGDFSAWTSTSGDVSVVDESLLTGGRFGIAFDDPTLEPNPVWTWLDTAYPNLVTSGSIQRGRAYELDRTDGGRATIRIADPDGILDPTNLAGPFYGKIEPLLQAIIRRYNPVLDTWETRFRGFVESYDYRVDPSQRITFLEITLVDIFEIVGAIEMLPGAFGDPPPAPSAGQVFFDNPGDVGTRITQILGNAGIPTDFYVVFTGNVDLYETVYSPGESALTAIQEAADAEFPGVSNVYPDRFGRLVFHGRLAKFDPSGVASGASPGQWDYHVWNAGDGSFVHVDPATYAQLREFEFERGLAKVINSAIATPINIADADVAGQTVTDGTSIGKYGIRSWSSQNLLTKTGLLDSSTALVETKRFATFYVDNYKDPKNRVKTLTFRTIRPDRDGASETWRLLTLVDISDSIFVSVQTPGGGAFIAEAYFVEGVTEEFKPLNGVYDDVTVSLDISPQSYYTTNPFPTS